MSKETSRKNNRGKIALLSAALALGATALGAEGVPELQAPLDNQSGKQTTIVVPTEAVSSETKQPMTYFQSDGTVYQMDFSGNVFPENDAESKFIPNSAGKWFLDRNSNGVQDTGEEFNAPRFTDEAMKSWNFAKEKTKKGIKVISHDFRYPDNQNPTQKNLLLIWSDGTMSLGPYQYAFDAQWFYDANGNGVKDAREGSMNASFNAAANTQLRQVMKLASEVRDAYQRLSQLETSSSQDKTRYETEISALKSKMDELRQAKDLNTTEVSRVQYDTIVSQYQEKTRELEGLKSRTNSEKANYEMKIRNLESEVSRLNVQLSTSVKTESERVSELEKLAKESESRYQTAVSETMLYQQKLADIQGNITEQSAPVSVAVQPVQTSVPISQSNYDFEKQRLLEEFPGMSPASVPYSQPVKTEEEKLEELANQTPRKESTMNLPQIQKKERTIEELYLSGEYQPPTTSKEEANRIEREHQVQAETQVDVVKTGTPKEKKKVNMPIGLSLDVIGGTGGLGIRRDRLDSLSTQNITGYVGGRLGISIPTRNPKLALGITFNGAYGLDEIVDSVTTEPTATGRYFSGNITNNNFVQGAIGMELQTGENFYFGTSVGAWINGQRTYEGLFNSTGEEIRANTIDRILASPSIDVYAGISGGRKMPIRFTGGWNSRKGIYGAIGFQIYPTKKE